MGAGQSQPKQRVAKPMGAQRVAKPPGSQRVAKPPGSQKTKSKKQEGSDASVPAAMLRSPSKKNASRLDEPEKTNESLFSVDKFEVKGLEDAPASPQDASSAFMF
eukprot:m.266009 g.266009  ORF g.266009 m.266009 type:complete len:105 (-) comp64909_c0_seq1:456-770(-)